MIYYTGDTHGAVSRIIRFCKAQKLTERDTLVILGDVGVNYDRNGRDAQSKTALASLPATVFCIHGNHGCRPHHIPSYRLEDWNGGKVWREETYPNLLFARDGDIYTLEGKNHLVLGGAYSVDKYYRLMRGYAWWPDEQPDDDAKQRAQAALDACGWKVDTVLSHTCPYKYEPREAFLPMIDQSSVDDSTERWLDAIEDRLSYERWYCGHWHINKHIDKMHFLFEDVEAAPAE